MMSKPRKGFHCPTCKVQLRIVDTRRRALGIVCRRRKCPTCDYRVQTEERTKQSAGH